MPSCHLNMFNLRLCNAAIIRYSQLKFGHMHLCGMDYKYFSPHCCKCNSFGCTAAIRCDNACQGPHSDSLYSGSEQCQFNSPRLVKREAGFPNPRRALIGSNQLWRVNDSAYFWEFSQIFRASISQSLAGNQIWLVRAEGARTVFSRKSVLYDDRSSDRMLMGRPMCGGRPWGSPGCPDSPCRHSAV